MYIVQTNVENLRFCVFYCWILKGSQFPFIGSEKRDLASMLMLMSCLVAILLRCILRISVLEECFRHTVSLSNRSIITVK